LAIYLARRWKSWQEVVPGAYETAGTPLPKLLANDAEYAGIDISDDVDTGYYTQDPVFEGEEDDAGVVDIDPPAPARKTTKRKASKRKK
jgi:hypothetical protein